VSLKENITMVKEELNTEEQFFEQAVKTERFVKKYKKALIGGVVLIVLIVAANLAYSTYEASGRSAANAAFMRVQEHPEDAKAAATLEAEAPRLYAAWTMARAVDAGDADALLLLENAPASEVVDISTYEAAVLAKDDKTLGDYAYRQNAIYRDLALIDEAVLLLKSGETAKAHQRLKMIPAESPASALASALAHYGVK